jgi:hypothetical protein
VSFRRHGSAGGFLGQWRRVSPLGKSQLHTLKDNKQSGISALQALISLTYALTLPFASPPYGAVSNAPRRAPSLSPPRSNCRTCCAIDWTSSVDTGATEGVSEVRSKLAGESGSRASTLIVLQLMSDILTAMVCSFAVRKRISAL